ncbi:hypothetical protein [Lentzea sp. NPDC055074]
MQQIWCSASGAELLGRDVVQAVQSNWDGVNVPVRETSFESRKGNSVRRAGVRNCGPLLLLFLLWGELVARVGGQQWWA